MQATLLILCLLALPPGRPVCPDGKCPWVIQPGPPVIVAPVIPPPPPVVKPPLVRFEEEKEPDLFFGVDHAKRAGRERCVVNGREVSSAYCLSLFSESGGAIPDDGGKMHLTLIGRDAAEWRRLYAMAASDAFKHLWEKYRVQTYDASNPVDKEMLLPFKLSDDVKLAKTGSVALLQPASTSGSAKVIWEMWQVADAGQVVEGVRKVDPEFDPNKQPGPNVKPTPGGPSETSAFAAAAAGGVLVAVLAFGWIASGISQRRES